MDVQCLTQKRRTYVGSIVSAVPFPSGRCMFHPVESWPRPGPRNGGRFLAVHLGVIFLSPNCGLTFFAPQIAGQKQAVNFQGHPPFKLVPFMCGNLIPPSWAFCWFSVHGRVRDAQGKVLGLCTIPFSESVTFWMSPYSV